MLLSPIQLSPDGMCSADMCSDDMCSADVGQVRHEDLASKYQLGHGCNLFGHFERPMVITEQL